jgi:hypothetical protein
MGRYGFTSPGALAGNAIQQFLMQREMAQRQAMLDQIAAQTQAEEQKRATAELELRTGQERRMADAQKAQIDDLANQREFGRATTIAENAMPHDPADEQTRALLERQGYGGQVNKVPGIVAPLLGSSPQSDAIIQPDGYEMRGGSKYLAARTAAEEKAAQAEATRTAADERASQDRDLRRDLAGVQSAGAAETRGLRNDLLKTQVDAAHQKQVEAGEVKQRNRSNAVRTAQETVDVIKQLADVGPDGTVTLKPGAANLFGMRMPGASFVPGSETATARGALDRLKSRTVVDLLNEMKQQSRTGATGFGAMNERELGILESGASQLGHSLISDESAANEIKRIYDIANRVLQGDSGGESGDGDGWITLPNGVRIREKR